MYMLHVHGVYMYEWCMCVRKKCMCVCRVREVYISIIYMFPPQTFWANRAWENDILWYTNHQRVSKQLKFSGRRKFHFRQVVKATTSWVEKGMWSDVDHRDWQKLRTDFETRSWFGLAYNRHDKLIYMQMYIRQPSNSLSLP